MTIYDVLFPMLRGMSDSELQAVAEECASLLTAMPSATPPGEEWQLVRVPVAGLLPAGLASPASPAVTPPATSSGTGRRRGGGGTRVWVKKVTGLDPTGKGLYAIQSEFVTDKQLKELVGLDDGKGHYLPVLVARRWNGELEAVLCEVARGMVLDFAGHSYQNLRRVAGTGTIENISDRRFAKFDGHTLSPIINGLLRERIPVQA